MSEPLRIVRIIPELLQLNGSLGNAEVIATRLRWWGFEVSVTDIPIGARLPRRPHLAVVGHGTSSTMGPAAEALESWGEKFRAWYSQGTCWLGIGLGGDLLGESIELPSASLVRPGLGFTTVRSRLQAARASSEVAGVDYLGGEMAGYLNDATARQGSVGQALVRFDRGPRHGWEGFSQPGAEGVVADRVWATSLSGPVLALNPSMADDIIKQVLGDENKTLASPTAKHDQADRASAMAGQRIRERLGLS